MASVLASFALLYLRLSVACVSRTRVVPGAPPNAVAHLSSSRKLVRIITQVHLKTAEVLEVFTVLCHEELPMGSGVLVCDMWREESEE
jgi:hypothetical protein